MQVTFKSAQTLGNKLFKAGKQVVPDHLAGNQKFKQLVKSGHAVVHPKDAHEQGIQISKDALNAKKSETARLLTTQMVKAKAAGASDAEIAKLLQPKTSKAK